MTARAFYIPRGVPHVPHPYYNVSGRTVEVIFGVAPCYRAEAS